jgi:hypothetical protein
MSGDRNGRPQFSKSAGWALIAMSILFIAALLIGAFDIGESKIDRMKTASITRQ